MSSQSDDSSVGPTSIPEATDIISNSRGSKSNKLSDDHALPEPIDSIGESNQNMHVAQVISAETGNENLSKYNVDFKPSSSSKQHIYSIRELLQISKDVPEKLSNSISGSLPKKSFWRLSSRHPDGSGGSNHKTNNFRIAEPGSEKKAHRSRGSRNGRRGSKFSKGEKHYVEEKDIKVNNDDLLALEEEIKPTGNSISDFENWKAKMKELERRKKGLPPLEKNEASERPPLDTNRSSLSDFFNLKKENSSNFEELESSDGHVDTPKGSSSRFSSFFSSASSSTPNIAHSSIAQPPTPKEDEARSATGSRVLSFFNKPEQRPMPEQHQNKGLNSVASDARSEPHENKVFVKEQTNNNFFQGLLNKGKSTDSIPTQMQEPLQYSRQGRDARESSINSNILGKTNAINNAGSTEGPPGLSKMPPNPQRGNLSSNFQMGMPTNMMPPMGQPMNMPPPGYPHFQMPPPGVHLPQQFFGDRPKQRVGQDGNDGNPEKNQRTQQMHAQFISGPPNIPPPGFAPMQGPPPGIAHDMQIPMNGMMPPHGFFPPQGPGFPQFGNPQMPSNGMPLQSHRMAPRRE
ncbi:LAFE_0C11936g1_1 [Lachancea fermentati]|uniref:LAFE_0C11936g1_1 n=1 Tax=Lachancea fermentati TaxID=4955 RepID=A0A1G4MAM4_LACFM|nr:LAFE_0C11936g1_1 [Lachancea fermentati]